MSQFNLVIFAHQHLMLGMQYQFNLVSIMQNNAAHSITTCFTGLRKVSKPNNITPVDYYSEPCTFMRSLLIK